MNDTRIFAAQSIQLARYYSNINVEWPGYGEQAAVSTWVAERENANYTEYWQRQEALALSTDPGARNRTRV